MFIMVYPSIIGRYFTGYYKRVTWNLLHAYIDSHSQRSIDEYPVDVLQAITISQSRCANMTFYEKA